MTIPCFGVAVPGTDYVLRPGGYALLRSNAGTVAVVETPQGHFLPGGGTGCRRNTRGGCAP